jgi:hypothetical protein
MFLTARQAAVFAIGFALLAAVAPVRADTAPVFVVPSRPGVPVVINGRDASWSVVEGDWGLARPGHMSPTIIGGGRPLARRGSYYRNPYHPSNGMAPQLGRHEIEPPPNRELPEPAESFSRVWSTTSEPRSSERAYNRAAGQVGERVIDEPPSLPPLPTDDAQQYAPPIVVVPHEDRRP